MKKALKVAMDVLAWVVLILAFLITLLTFTSARNNGISNLFGYSPMTVESDSMAPTFNKGDMIIIKQISDLYKLKEGDVITFYTIINGKRVLNTHRIVRVNESENTRSFATRGDNNPIDDDMPAYASDIVGKWTGTRLAGLGKAMNFLRTKKGFFICVLIPMALFFLFELYKFVVVLIDAKRPETLTAEDEEAIKKKAIEEYLAAEREKAAKAADELKKDAGEILKEEAAPVENSDNASAEDSAPTGDTAE